MKRFFLAATVLAASTLSAHAQLIAGDAYDIGTSLSGGQYVAGALNSTTNLGAKNSPTGLVSTGFVNGAYADGKGTAQYTASTGSLTSGSFAITNPASGGKVTYGATALSSTPNLRNVARELSPVTGTGTTYWLSALVNCGTLGAVGAGLSRDVSMSGFGGTVTNAITGANYTGTLAVGNTNGVTGLFYGFTGNADNTINLSIRYRNTANTIVQTSLLPGNATANTTYSLLFRVESGFVGGVADRLTYWVDPANATVAAGEAALDAAQSGQITTANILSAGTDFTRLTYAANNWNANTFFDEQRLGRNLQSVTPNVSAATVPETGTLSLLAAGFATLGGIVLRKRKAA